MRFDELANCMKEWPPDIGIVLEYINGHFTACLSERQPGGDWSDVLATTVAHPSAERVLREVLAQAEARRKPPPISDWIETNFGEVVVESERRRRTSSNEDGSTHATAAAVEPNEDRRRKKAR